jgi:hypothetical protein
MSSAVVDLKGRPRRAGIKLLVLRYFASVTHAVKERK